MKNALIIFVRHPVPGKVKTRLAATLGNDTALHIYKKLLHHTFSISKKVEADKFIFYADEIVQDDLWQHEHYYKLKQPNGDLGKRMMNAFELIFSKGYSKVCIIGSDCFELSSNIITEAFALLNDHDIVVGPAVDGGYYLLAMNQLYQELFENKSWSTSHLLDQTIESIEELKLTFAKLEVLSDVDEASDVPQEWLSIKN